MESTNLYITDSGFSIYKDTIYSYADTLLDIPSNYKGYGKAKIMLDDSGNIVADYIETDTTIQPGVYIKCYNATEDKFVYYSPDDFTVKADETPIGISVKVDNMRKYTMGISDVIIMEPKATNIYNYYVGLYDYGIRDLIRDINNKVYDINIYDNGNTAKKDFLGKVNTKNLLMLKCESSNTSSLSSSGGTGTLNATSPTFDPAHNCNKYYTPGTKAGEWWLPSLGEMLDIFNKIDDIRNIGRILASYGYRYLDELLSRYKDEIYTSTIGSWYYETTSIGFNAYRYRCYMPIWYIDFESGYFLNIYNDVDESNYNGYSQYLGYYTRRPAVIIPISDF